MISPKRELCVVTIGIWVFWSFAAKARLANHWQDLFLPDIPVFLSQSLSPLNLPFRRHTVFLALKENVLLLPEEECPFLPSSLFPTFNV